MFTFNISKATIAITFIALTSLTINVNQTSASTNIDKQIEKYASQMNKIGCGDSGDPRQSCKTLGKKHYDLMENENKRIQKILDKMQKNGLNNSKGFENLKKLQLKYIYTGC